MEKDLIYLRETVDRIESEQTSSMKSIGLELQAIRVAMEAIKAEIVSLKLKDAENQLPINLIIDIVKYVLLAATGAVAALVGGSIL